MILDMRTEDSLMYFSLGDMCDLYNNIYKNRHKLKPNIFKGKDFFFFEQFGA